MILSERAYLIWPTKSLQWSIRTDQRRVDSLSGNSNVITCRRRHKCCIGCFIEGHGIVGNYGVRSLTTTRVSLGVDLNLLSAHIIDVLTKSTNHTYLILMHVVLSSVIHFEAPSLLTCELGAKGTVNDLYKHD